MCASLTSFEPTNRGKPAQQPRDRLAVEAKSLADLKVEKAAVECEHRSVEADLGPVRHLATLIGADNQTVLRWSILVVALLLDPGPGLATVGGDFN
jgi:hypothetical protein